MQFAAAFMNNVNTNVAIDTFWCVGPANFSNIIQGGGSPSLLKQNNLFLINKGLL